MRPAHRTLPIVLLLLIPVPAMSACSAGPTPGQSPSPTITTPATSASPSATPSAGNATPSGTPAPTATPGPNPTGWTVVSARVAYQWHWPNGDPHATVTHTSTVATPPELVTIGVGDHPADPGERPYNRMSFSFATAYPSYQFAYVEQLVGDASGLPIQLPGHGVLRIAFTPARAHTEDGASTIISQPAANLGLSRMVGLARAGDFENHLTYGIGITYPIRESNPQIAVRAYEVTYVNGQGVYRYVVAIDVDAG